MKVSKWKDGRVVIEMDGEEAALLRDILAGKNFDGKLPLALADRLSVLLKG